VKTLPANRQARSSRQASLFAFEDVQIRNLVKHRHLAKSINDAAWGRFLWWVQYDAAMQAVPCLAVPPEYHQSGL
jgi:putative transposase